MRHPPIVLPPEDDDDEFSDFDDGEWDGLPDTDDAPWPVGGGPGGAVAASPGAGAPPGSEPPVGAGRRSRARRPPPLTSRTSRRVDPRTADRPPAQCLLRVVRAFGAVGAGVAARTAARLWGRSPGCYHRAAQACERRGYLARLSVTDLGIARAPGLGLVLVPGERWLEWDGRRALDGVAEALGGTSGAPLLAEDSRRQAIVEQLVLSAEVLRRVLGGWEVRRGDAWLADALALDRERAATGVEAARAHAARTGTVRFADGDAPVGLLPPNPKAALPALLVGGVYAPAGAFDRHAAAVQLLAPLEVICAGRSLTFIDGVRRGARRHLDGRGHSPVRVLSLHRGAKWARFWEAVDERLAVTGDAACVERLERWLGPR